MRRPFPPSGIAQKSGLTALLSCRAPKPLGWALPCQRAAFIECGSTFARAEVVEYACSLAPDLMGDYIENVATGMDTYSIRQPLGVSRFAPSACSLLSALLVTYT